MGKGRRREVLKRVGCNWVGGRRVGLLLGKAMALAAGDLFEILLLLLARVDNKGGRVSGHWCAVCDAVDVAAVQVALSKRLCGAWLRWC